jgi:DHA1 family bicyclomycin/chloramphenicol resistance-like MFS transporter
MKSSKPNLTFIALIGSIMMLGALATDMVLPAFPSIANRFGISVSEVQLILIAFMFGHALPHVVIGSVADRFGRRPVLIAGLVVFGIGAAICLAAPNFSWILIGRFVQGLGSAAGPILARAILRDLFHGAQLGQYLSFSMAYFTLTPLLAPGIGTLLLTQVGWRAIFVLLILVAIALTLWVICALPETLVKPNLLALDLRAIVQNGWCVLRHPQSSVMVLIISLFHGSLMAYLFSSPGIYMNYFEINEVEFSLIFAAIASLLLPGNIINAILLKKYSPVRILGYALVLNFVVGVVMFLQTSFGWATVFTLTINLASFFFCLAFVFANATTLAIDPHKTRAGVASGLLGFLQIVSGTLLGSLIGKYVAIGPTPLGLGMVLIATTVLTIFLISQRLAPRFCPVND